MKLGPLLRLLALGSAALATGCAADRNRELVVRKTLLAHEVAGLRHLTELLDRGGTVVPDSDIAVVIEGTLVRELIAAQLPFEADVERFHVRLMKADVQFHGSAVVALRGDARLRRTPAVQGTLSVLGALDEIAVDRVSGVLRAKITIDEIRIEKAGGLESVLSGRALERLAGSLRTQLAALLPTLEIPVRVQQRLDLPAVTTGPFRIAAASLPLEVDVTRVVAGRGRLWIGVRLHPGRVAKSGQRAAPPGSGSAPTKPPEEHR